MRNRSISIISSLSSGGGSVEDLGTAAYKNAGNNAGNVPVIDNSGKLDESVIPTTSVTEVYSASSEEDMLDLSADKGDMCIRTDENKTYVLVDSPASTLANWVQISTLTSVASVNSKTGAVVLDSDDVGAVAKNTAITGATKCKITYDSKGLVTAGADLTSSDIPDLSSDYVAANNSITGATKCKITYDSKGLVTSGADLATTDIPDLSASYIATNTAITGATKCKITYDSKGLVTAGADLTSSDIPDLSGDYVAANNTITGATKCKITYDGKGLVTSGADLSSSDIPDLSSDYVATNTAITGATKCKITYDSKGLVTAGSDLAAADLPSHTHAASDITSGTIGVSNGGTGASTAEGALVNLNLIDTTEQDFAGNSESDYITAVRNYFEATSEDYIPFVFNAGWQGQGYGMAAGVKTLDLDDPSGQTRSIMIFNQKSGVKFYIRQPDSQWYDYSPNGIVLYENSSGTKDTITLSDDSQFYKYFEIYYKNDSGVFSSTKVESPNGKEVQIQMLSYYGANMYLRAACIEISGTSITWRSGSYGWGTTSNTGTSIYGGSNLLYITKVVAYR